MDKETEASINHLKRRVTDLEGMAARLIKNMAEITGSRLTATYHDNMALHTLASNVQELAGLYGLIDGTKLAIRELEWAHRKDERQVVNQD